MMWKELNVQIHTHTNEILFSFVKKENVSIGYNIDELQDHYANKISQSQESEYCRIPLIYSISEIVKFIEVKNGMLFAGGWGGGNEE